MSECPSVYAYVSRQHFRTPYSATPKRVGLVYFLALLLLVERRESEKEECQKQWVLALCGVETPNTRVKKRGPV